MTRKATLSQYARRYEQAGAGVNFRNYLTFIVVFLLPPGSALARVVPVEVSATPIERFDATGRTRIGAVEFRGGIVLSSDYDRFGGLSGMQLDGATNRLIALTDKGYWFSATLETEGDWPVGLTDAKMAPMLAEDGSRLATLGRGDTESLVLTPAGVAVGIERWQEIWLFPGTDPLGARGKSLFSFRGIAVLGSNEGIEALAMPPSGQPASLVVIAERDPKDPTILPGFLLSPLEAPRLAGRFVIERIDEFNATDLALATDGMAYLLERRFDLLRGVSMRIRRFPISQAVDGARISGEVVIEAHRVGAIDNMEALAVTRNAAGETILTVMSDDNFSLLQRTVLLRFAVVGTGD